MSFAKNVNKEWMGTYILHVEEVASMSTQI